MVHADFPCEYKMSATNYLTCDLPIDEFHSCDFCNAVVKVEVHSVLIGTVDIVPPGFEVEPHTPDDACPEIK